MHVRRLMSGTGGGAMDPATKHAMLGFLDGGAVVVSLNFSRFFDLP